MPSGVVSVPPGAAGTGAGGRPRAWVGMRDDSASWDTGAGPGARGGHHGGSGARATALTYTVPSWQTGQQPGAGWAWGGGGSAGRAVVGEAPSRARQRSSRA